jgi:hypothetical protein
MKQKVAKEHAKLKFSVNVAWIIAIPYGEENVNFSELPDQNVSGEC